MNKFYFPLIVVIIFAGSCKSQVRIVNNISCSGKVTVQYDRIKPSDKDLPKAEKNLDAFMVYFLSEFNDSIKAYVNNKLVFEEYIKLGADSHNLDNFFGYNYSKDSSTPVLKVRSLSRETCFDIQVEKEYKLIYLFINEEEEWTVRFSNNYYIH